jgi:hypothetical protein
MQEASREFQIMEVRSAVQTLLDTTGITIHTGWYVASPPKSETQSHQVAQS